MALKTIFFFFSQIIDIQKNFSNSFHILVWKSKGLSHESIKSPGASNNTLVPTLNYINTKMRVKFDGNHLKQDTIIFIH